MRARARLHCIGVSVTSPTQAAGLVSSPSTRWQFFVFFYFYQASWLIGDEQLKCAWHSPLDPKLLGHQLAGLASDSFLSPLFV
jgi:hypothetical protein